MKHVYYGPDNESARKMAHDFPWIDKAVIKYEKTDIRMVICAAHLESFHADVEMTVDEVTYALSRMRGLCNKDDIAITNSRISIWRVDGNVLLSIGHEVKQLKNSESIDIQKLRQWVEVNLNKEFGQ